MKETKNRDVRNKKDVTMISLKCEAGREAKKKGRKKKERKTEREKKKKSKLGEEESEYK